MTPQIASKKAKTKYIQLKLHRLPGRTNLPKINQDLAFYKTHFPRCLVKASRRKYPTTDQCTLHRLPVEVRQMILRHVLELQAPGCNAAWATYLPQLDILVGALPCLQPDLRLCLMHHATQLSLRLDATPSETTRVHSMSKKLLFHSLTCHTCPMRFMYAIATLLECGATPADFLDTTRSDGGPIHKALAFLCSVDSARTWLPRELTPMITALRFTPADHVHRLL
jgi:hypothetical protein